MRKEARDTLLEPEEEVSWLCGKRNWAALIGSPVGSRARDEDLGDLTKGVPRQSPEDASCFPPAARSETGGGQEQRVGELLRTKGGSRSGLEILILSGCQKMLKLREDFRALSGTRYAWTTFR